MRRSPFRDVCRHHLRARLAGTAAAADGYDGSVQPPGFLAPLVAELRVLREVRAAAVVGSRSSGAANTGSDVDLFVYLDTAPEQLLDDRRRLADRLGDHELATLVQQPGHPYADTWSLRGTGVYLDVMFWTCDWAEAQVEAMRVRHADLPAGASTAFCRSIRDGLPLLDETQWLSRLRAGASAEYPASLRAHLVARDMARLRAENPFSFTEQLTAAVARRDLVAGQHACARWLETYLDAVFAANRVLHPGEKRLLDFAERECARPPARLRRDVEALVVDVAAASPASGDDMARLLAGLGAVVVETEP